MQQPLSGASFSFFVPVHHSPNPRRLFHVMPNWDLFAFCDVQRGVRIAKLMTVFSQLTVRLYGCHLMLRYIFSQNVGTSLLCGKHVCRHLCELSRARLKDENMYIATSCVTNTVDTCVALFIRVLIYNRIKVINSEFVKGKQGEKPKKRKGNENSPQLRFHAATSMIPKRIETR